MHPRGERRRDVLIPAWRGLHVAVAVALMLLGLAVLPSRALAEQTLGLSTGSFTFSVGAGQGGKGSLFVSNDGDAPLQVLVYTADQVVDAKGHVDYKVPKIDDANAMSQPANWVQVKMPAQSKSVGNTPYLELKPGQQVPVSFSFTTPQDVAPGDHQVILFFEIFELKRNAQGAMTKVAGRIGARIKVRVQGELVERIDVRPFVVPGFVMNGQLPYVFDINNDGNVDKTVGVTVALLNANEEELYTSTVLTDTAVYAGTQLERSGTLKPKLGFGKYTVRLTMQYQREGAKDSTVAERIVKDRTVWLVPYWVVGLAGTPLLLLILWLLWRSASRSADRRAEKRLEQRMRQREERAARRAAQGDGGADGGVDAFMQTRTIESPEAE